MNLEVNGFNALNIVLVTFVTSLLLVPIIKKVANHVNALDIPNERKVHKTPIPRLGGLAIFLAFLLGYILYGKVSTQMLSVLIGGFIIILTGIVDDIKPIPARYKFICQTIAAMITVVYGKLYFSNITLLGLNLIFPTWVNMILSTIFIVAIINAINLIDGLDGLSSGISLISCLSLIIIFSLNGSPLIAIIMITALAGALTGFLPFNFNPAKTFIGDTGSNFLGYSLSVISILGVAKTYTLIVIVAPLIVLALPIFDTLFAIIRRLIKGKSLKAVVMPDKGHLHHQMLKKGFTQKEAVLVLYGISATFGMFAIVLLESGIWKALSFALIVIAVIATRL